MSVQVRRSQHSWDNKGHMFPTRMNAVPLMVCAQARISKQNVLWLPVVSAIHRSPRVDPGSSVNVPLSRDTHQ